MSREVVIIGAGARGNRVFAELISRHETGFTTRAVVEPDRTRREAFRDRYGIAPEHTFVSVDEFLAAPRCGDIVFICTPDPTHYALCRAVSEKGYDVLLEKPIATSLAECMALLEVERRSRNRIFVAHVLRYAPFFRTVKRIIESGRLGAIRNIHLVENVGHWHFAHSYVRGNWRRRDETAPIVLTKCSHDLDILAWLVDEPVVSVTSYGSLVEFTEANAPADAAERCVDCPLQDDCLYSATRFYVHEEAGWPFDVIAHPPNSLAARRDAVAEGLYGRCVWKCDNDVCDNQTVILELEPGIHATLGLQAHTAENTRKLTILFEQGELTGDLAANRLVISRFLGSRDRTETEEVALPEVADLQGHGGGDLELLHALSDHLDAGAHGDLMTSLESSLTSHILAFLADESRTNENVKLPVSDALIPDRLMDPGPAPS